MAAQVRIGRIVAQAANAQLPAAFSGTGALSATAAPTVALSVPLTGNGAMTATLTPPPAPVVAPADVSGARARLGLITASVTSPYAARVRIGRITANVQPPTAGVPHVRIGRVLAAVTPGLNTLSAGLIRRNGAWPSVTSTLRKAGAWVAMTPQIRRGSAWALLNPVPPSGGPAPMPAIAGFTPVLGDNFATLDTSRWFPYDNSTFGSPSRVQRYMARNCVTGPGSAGSTGGTSLKMLSKREAVGGNAFTAGMLDSRTAGQYYPRYGRFEMRAKIPHGQGLWPAWWLTAKNGGATTSEFDIMEYFHAQLPGKNSASIHGTDNTGTFHANRYTNNGATGNGIGGRTFFEAPTLTPGWHVWACEILPVTDATGNTLADPSQPSGYVRRTDYLDGVQVWRIVDTSALYWTTNGGDPDSFWNVYLQGCQIDGNYVGSPDGPLGYSHWLNACLAGGTAPNACTTTIGGYTAQLPTFGDPSSTFEIDYHRVWKYTG